MSKRTVKIFSIFVAVAIVGSLFIYFFRGYGDRLVSSFISEITICGNIVDEESCQEKNFCEGIYGPSCPGCEDLEFKRCQRVPLNALVQMEEEKVLCQDTGGEWYTNKLGNFCLCQQAGLNKIFDKELGCINK
ncbi:MAG: hypothetical protein CMI53_05330 [Parcubacteria group bacterium]|nr:hypothetical protein [Parcubacteria group bacterium]|tara:strand:+ start:2536 stop:2934 length:399 start_codon:yes stop_codon:yes gene_type:complete